MTDPRRLTPEEVLALEWLENEGPATTIEFEDAVDGHPNCHVDGQKMRRDLHAAGMIRYRKRDGDGLEEVLISAEGQKAIEL